MMDRIIMKIISGKMPAWWHKPGIPRILCKGQDPTFPPTAADHHLSTFHRHRSHTIPRFFFCHSIFLGQVFFFFLSVASNNWIYLPGEPIRIFRLLIFWLYDFKLFGLFFLQKKPPPTFAWLCRQQGNTLCFSERPLGNKLICGSHAAPEMPLIIFREGKDWLMAAALTKGFKKAKFWQP